MGSWYGRASDAWKHRNDRPWREKYGVRPKASPRRAGFEPQWTVEQLWRNPFREQRRWATDGQRVWKEWVPVPAPVTTGVRIFDEWIAYIAGGDKDFEAFCSQYEGLRKSDLEAMAFVLTGMGAAEFHLRHRVMTLDVMLRYTDLPPGEVARRSGIGSLNNLYLTCKREWGVAPMVRRKAIQKEEDIGRYR